MYELQCTNAFVLETEEYYSQLMQYSTFLCLCLACVLIQCYILFVGSAGKGCGVIATLPFGKENLYSGDLISRQEAEKREQQYSKDPSIGCYIFCFTHKSKHLW